MPTRLGLADVQSLGGEELPPPHQSNLSVELAGLDRLPALHEEWERLFDQVRCDNPFLSFEWAEVCSRHSHQGTTALFAVARKADLLVGVAPLEIARVRPLGRELRFLGSGLGDYGGFLLTGEDEEGIVRLLLDALLRSKRFDQLALEGFRGRQEGHRACAKLLRACGARERLVAESPFIELKGDYAAYWKSRSRNTREYLKKARNKPARESRQATFWRIESLDPKRLAAICDIHAARHSFRPGTSILHRSSGRAFLSDLSQALSARGRLDVAGVDIDGEMSAFCYGIRLRETYYYWLCGFSPDKAAYSPGNLLMDYLVSSSYERGLQKIDLMVGTESYKDKWATGREYDYGIEYRLPGHRLSHALQDSFGHLRDFARAAKDETPLLQLAWRKIVSRR